MQINNFTSLSSLILALIHGGKPKISPYFLLCILNISIKIFQYFNPHFYNSIENSMPALANHCHTGK